MSSNDDGISLCHAERLHQDTFTKEKVDSHHFELSKNGEVHCIPCSQFKLGKEYKTLSNVYAHVKHKTHLDSVMKPHDQLFRKRAFSSDWEEPSKKQKMDDTAASIH